MAQGGLRRISECYVDILRLNTLDLDSMVVELISERFRRKSLDIMEIFKSVSCSWNETFYLMFLRTLGGAENKGAMTELGRRVTHSMLMREKGSLLSLEAMLLGGSGLLFDYPVDSYTRLIHEEFTHLASKYRIEPMKSSDWQLSTLYPHNHPTLRLAQVASCIHNGDFSMSRALDCHTSEDIYELFAGRASEYWLENFLSAGNSPITSRRIGHLKSDLLGINLVAAIRHAYGLYTQSEDTIASTYELLESISAESNRYTNPWFTAGVEPINATISQALIQLSKEYCAHSRCSECPLARRLDR